jgi:hypothetical protein
MPMSGVALGAVAVGSVLVYAGVTGRDVLAAVQAVVQGKSPGTAPAGALAIGGTAAAPSSPSGPADVAAPVSDPQFSTAVLAGVGAPTTASNVRSIESWIGREGGGGLNNPLNTTYPLGGSTSFNGVGVQNYPTYADGVDATIRTLENGNYGDILLLLRGGDGLCGHELAGLSAWSGGGYSEVC